MAPKVEPEKSLVVAHAVSFVARNEFDFTIEEIADGQPWSDIRAFLSQLRGHHLCWREARDSPWTLCLSGDAGASATCDRKVFRQPSIPTFRSIRAQLQIALYFLCGADGEAIVIASARSKTSSVKCNGVERLPAGEGVLLRRRHADRQSAACRSAGQELGKLGVTWSCNAGMPRKTLEIADIWSATSPAISRSLINVEEGMRIDFARRFRKDCTKLGIIHETFILGAGRPGNHSTATPRRSITRSRYRSQRHIRAPSPPFFARRSAGSSTKKSIC